MKIKTSSIDYICGGMLLYTVSVTIIFFYLPQYISWITDFIALIITFYGILKRGVALKNLDSDIVVALFSMIIISFFVMLNTLFLRNFNLPHIITQNVYVLPLFLPIISFLNINKPAELSKLYNYLFIGCIITFIHFMYKGYGFIFTPEDVTRGMDAEADLGLYEFLRQVTIGMYLVLPLFIYYICNEIPGKLQLCIIIITILLSTIITASFGRRATTFCMLFMLISPLLLKTITGRHKFAVLGIFIFVLIIFYTFYEQIMDFFPALSRRMNDNTREDFNQMIFTQYNGIEFLFGRGAGATYNDYYQGTRSSMETGYLLTIMREGFIYLLLYVYILIIPGLRAIIKGNNKFIKGCGLFLIFECLQLSVVGVRSWSTTFLVVFISVALCSNKKIREQKKLIIFSKK